MKLQKLALTSAPDYPLSHEHVPDTIVAEVSVNSDMIYSPFRTTTSYRISIAHCVKYAFRGQAFLWHAWICYLIDKFCLYNQSASINESMLIVQSCLQGLISVRAFRLQSRFGERHNKLLDASSQCWWPLVTSNRWLSVRLETIGNALVFCTAVAAAMILSQR